MAKMRFSFQEAESTVKSLEKNGAQVDAKLKALEKEIRGVESWWEGDAVSEFIKQYDDLKKSLKQLSELATTLGTQLKEVATTKQKTEENIAKMFKR